MLCEPVAVIFVQLGDETHVRDFLHLAEEENHRHDQAGADANRQVEDNGEREGGNQHAEVRARTAPQFDEGVPFRHAQRDREQNRAQAPRAE